MSDRYMKVRHVEDESKVYWRVLNIKLLGSKKPVTLTIVDAVCQQKVSHKLSKTVKDEIQFHTTTIKAFGEYLQTFKT